MSLSADDLIALVRTRGRGDPPAAMGEVFTNPTVTMMQYLDTKLQFSRIEQTLDSIIATLEDDAALADLATRLGEDQTSIENRLKQAIDDIAGNFGILRRAPAPSKGTVVVFRSTPLAAPVTIPSGFKFFSPSLNQEYGASETVQITSMSFDTTLNKFVAFIPVDSVNTGLDTMAAIGQVTQIRDSNPQLEGVTNTEPLVGGRDQESDRDLANRAKTALSANNIGTKSGYRNLVLSLSDVRDASVVGAGDPLMARDMGDGGSVDVYVTDIIPVQVNEVGAIGVNLDPTGLIFTPSRQPILNNLGTVTTTIGSPTLITKDATVYAGSVEAKDTITFDADQSGATITYFVNDNVRRTQEFMDDPSRQILGSDLLVKEAVLVLVYATFNITVLSGFTKSVVAANVQNAVTQFISALGIGVSLEQSDILKVAVEVDGVDRVDLPMIRFDRGGLTPQQLNVIEATANEVLRVGSVVVNF